MRAKWKMRTVLLGLMCPMTVVAALTTVTPRALTGPLTNPGTGVASFHQGYGQTLGLADYPDTGLEYVRFYWRDVEPVEGKYNFALIDNAFKFAAAHKPAMTVGLRFMALADPESGSHIPDWLIKKGVKGIWTSNKKTFVPDLDDPLFIEYSQRLLSAFGQRYDGNENLAFIDIGMVGSWGEWHNNNFRELKKLLERYTTAQLERYVKMHFSTFPRTPKIMLISGGENLINAVKQGAGWRADCWGDLRIFSSAWNHMRDDYPQRLQAAQAGYSGFNDAWKRAPISLEICGYMSEWKSVKHYTQAEVQGIFDWAIKQHASTINLKSRAVPSEYRSIVNTALTKLGYRFRLGSLSHESVWQPGSRLALNSTWFNDGVAPVYLPYTLSFRVTDISHKIIAQGKTLDDIRSWLPGKHLVNYQLPMPGTLAKGRYFIEVAMLDKSGASRINLANEGKQSDGWYRVSTITVQ